jgi:coenzyme F420-reducing hydrogenase gamma subunit
MTLTPKATKTTPKVAVYKFSSCDGCQLSLLNLEDELLDLASAVDISYFLEATRSVKPGPYDIGIVEGSITTPHEAERIKEVRNECKYLIALGTCATAGGIQALRNFAVAADYAKSVYAHPDFLDYLDKSTSIAENVTVDLAIWGCPVNKYMVVEVIAALLQNRRPNFPPSPVCLECKRNGTVCVVVAQGIPCLGPVVHGGCGALCPANGRGCYGCFGPSSVANFSALVEGMVPRDRYPNETADLLRSFSGHSPLFKNAADQAFKLSEGKENK